MHHTNETSSIPPRRERLQLCSEEGSTLVEFALVLPVALLLLFGIVQCSLVLLQICNATFACSVAARYASLHSAESVRPATPAMVEATVRSLLWTSSEDVTIESTWAPSNIVGGTVTVTVREAAPFSIPFSPVPPFVIGSTTQRVVVH